MLTLIISLSLTTTVLVAAYFATKAVDEANGINE